MSTRSVKNFLTLRVKNFLTLRWFLWGSGSFAHESNGGPIINGEGGRHVSTN